MLGHRIDSVTEAYFKADINSLKKEYMKAMQDLSFEKVEVKKVTTPEYDTLIQELRDERAKREDMQKQMERMIAENKIRDERLEKILKNKIVAESLITY